jgi:hypothetical protein
LIAANLSGWVIKLWKRAIIDPSYSSPSIKSDFYDIGENDFHKMVSHMLMAMKSEIAEFPTPYPFVNNSSKSMTITPANVN